MTSDPGNWLDPTTEQRRELDAHYEELHEAARSDHLAYWIICLAIAAAALSLVLALLP